MDEKLEYDGKTYYRRNGKWYDSSYCEVLTHLQDKLNKLYNNSINYDTMDYYEIIKIADGFKKTNSFTMAITTYEIALEKTNKKYEIKYILPRITSCYRMNHQPNKAIELYSRICKNHGYEILNSVLLTSIAAAYCDLGQFDNAKKCADRAYAISNGKADEELKLVYKRINQN